MTLDKLARKIDRIYIDAAKARYAGKIPVEALYSMVESQPENLPLATEFLDLVEKNPRYREVNKAKALDLFHEIKLQTAFIMIAFGQYNTSVYDRLASHGNTDQQIADDLHLLLNYLSVTQDVVVKSRILFERIMNFIFFLENRSELGGSTRKSKKRKFFESIDGTPWSFLLRYKDFVDVYDQSFRTAEVHAGSFLKRYLAENSLLDSEVIMSLSNFLMNVFWPNLKQILLGRSASLTTWNRGMESLVGMTADDARLP